MTTHESPDQNDSFVAWIEEIRSGNEQAVKELFERFFPIIAQFAERRLTRATRRVETGEDVALSAMHSFIKGVKGDRFSELRSDEDLRRLLVVISGRKATRYNERQHAQKRGGGMVRGESVFAASTEEMRRRTLSEAAVEDDFQRRFESYAEELLEQLEDESLKTIVLLKLQGADNDQIASELGCVPRTIRRKLQLIMQCWDQSHQSDDSAD